MENTSFISPSEKRFNKPTKQHSHPVFKAHSKLSSSATVNIGEVKSFSAEEPRLPRSHSEEDLAASLDEEQQFDNRLSPDSPNTSMSGMGEKNEFLDLLNDEDDQNLNELHFVSSDENYNVEESENIENEENEGIDDNNEEYEEEVFEEEEENSLYVSMATDTREEDKLLLGTVDGKETILGGTVDELINSLTTKKFGKIIYDSINSVLNTPPFVIQFLFTYRYFTSSSEQSVPARELFGRLMDQFPTSIPATASPEQQSSEGTLQLRIIGLIKHWVEHHFYDFTEDLVLLEQLLGFISNAIADNSVSSDTNGVLFWAAHLQKTIEQKIIDSITPSTSETALAALQFQIKTVGISKLSVMWLKIASALIKNSELPDQRKDKKKKTLLGNHVIDWLFVNLNLGTREESVQLAERVTKNSLLLNMKEKSLTTFSSSGYFQFAENKKETSTEKENQTPMPKPYLPKNSRVTNLDDINPIEMARQMTLIDSHYFRKITPKELSHQNWNKPDAKINAPILIHLIERFNDISYWVATELVGCSSLKLRVNLLKKFIYVAEQCRKLNNFHSLMAILVGLNLGCVQKLRKSWESLTKPYITLFEQLNQFVNTERNYLFYRKELKKATVPVIPYLVVYLKDLTFIEDGNKNFRPNGMVNFEKMSMLSRVFQEVADLQKSKYMFVDVNPIQQYLLHLQVIRDDKELYKLAAGAEAKPVSRNASTEKQLKKVSEVKSISAEKLPGKVTPKSPEKPPAMPKQTSMGILTMRKKKLGSGIKRSLKIVLVGDGMVGKTSLLVAKTTKVFPATEYVPTIFDNYMSNETFEGQEINLILWDTAGQEDLSRVRTLNYAGTDCFIVCYSVINKDSFLNIAEKWLPEIENHKGNAIIVFAGLKADVPSDPSQMMDLDVDAKKLVSKEEAEALTKEKKAAFHMLVSARTLNNVQNLFIEAIRATLAKDKSKSKKR